MNLHDITKAWNEFFFKPASPLPMAVFRVLFSCILLFCLLVQLYPDLMFWYGPHAVVSSESVHNIYFAAPTFDLLQLFDGNEAAIKFVFWSMVMSTTCLLLGLFTRFSAIYCFLVLLSLHRHSPFNLNGGDCVLRICAFFLAVSYCGHTLSIDAWWQKRKGTPYPAEVSPWAQRLLQIQIAIVYWQASFWKMMGQQWVDGNAIYYATHLQDLCRASVPLFDQIWPCRILSWGAVFVETAMWTLIWIKECRYAVLIAAAIMHVFIDLMFNLPLFEWIFIASFVCFIEPMDLMAVFAILTHRLRLGGIGLQRAPVSVTANVQKDVNA